MNSGGGNNRGCWFAISRCFNSKPSHERYLYSKAANENIEFEDLVTAEKKASEARKKKQMVTELEKEHAMNGNFNQLVEHQRKIDEERDAQLRKQEEALRREEEAYYAAKREAASKRAKQSRVPVSLEIEEADKSDVTFNFPVLTKPTPPTSNSIVVGGASLMGLSNVGLAQIPHDDNDFSHEKDDDDFDQFLESVKVKQLSISNRTTGPPVSKQPVLTQSDSEEEIDFGFWEKAPVPSNGIPNSVLPNHDNARTENGFDKDLSLL